MAMARDRHGTDHGCGFSDAARDAADGGWIFTLWVNFHLKVRP
jgi:hypothetical protein